MTCVEFYDLQIGDDVKLPFSSNSVHKVVAIDRQTNMVSTKPVDSINSAIYVNAFWSIEIIPKVKEEHIKEKEQILAMFESFRENGCNNCPFHEECSNVYEETRAHSTSATLTICEALRKQDIDYD